MPDCDATPCTLFWHSDPLHTSSHQLALHSILQHKSIYTQAPSHPVTQADFNLAYTVSVIVLYTFYLPRLGIRSIPAPITNSPSTSGPMIAVDRG